MDHSPRHPNPHQRPPRANRAAGPAAGPTRRATPPRGPPDDRRRPARAVARGLRRGRAVPVHRRRRRAHRPHPEVRGPALRTPGSRSPSSCCPAASPRTSPRTPPGSLTPSARTGCGSNRSPAGGCGSCYCDDDPLNGTFPLPRVPMGRADGLLILGRGEDGVTLGHDLTSAAPHRGAGPERVRQVRVHLRAARPALRRRGRADHRLGHHRARCSAEPGTTPRTAPWQVTGTKDLRRARRRCSTGSWR